MNQQEFDFNKDINEPSFTAEDNLRINEIVSDYQAKKNTIDDEAIIIKLFFEEYCIEITKRLKSLGYFDVAWEFESNSFGRFYYDFINDKKTFNSSTLREFIVLYLNNMNSSLRAIDFQKYSRSDFSFDRKITEGISQQIQDGDIKNAVNLYLVYLKIWNHFDIYKEPFNNQKAQLINDILSNKIWPKDLISFVVYTEFEQNVKQVLKSLSINDIYIPFFDDKVNTFYSEIYLKSRNKLKSNIDKLFEYDLTDETEPYCVLIEDIISNPSENKYKKDIILSKVAKQMMPSEKDVKMFLKLYESTFEKELGKLLLSKFYLYNFLNYDL